ncbi:bifunctional adenosylcobinamide kinase/adenosylcobinamide-phosphate guanylyltransferase [Oceanispirochaeta crateris]|uniref:Adenosylcobinamide kinase n=1 Tax=Oceanispirochaeta crateris TaxID=2518645 RepID=A0A5C1QJ75_9SPIO|nr:bifunctional adenosylcobinamide kinase/adenosylcobinamide-phosphate guanylyltransferase [Oceanispirochaeta crateris]QEN07517.1 bifunctional adenosylcobinamide kinase/adenosylcobinamide-phosphate guanylyltransferase [Oceanispirochaeta crateris]
MIFVLGGVKSGKTSWAENRAAQWALRNNGTVVYLASARAWDDEMKLRIHRHKLSRPKEWETIEEPLHITDVLKGTDFSSKHIVLFDCLTLWMTNLLMELGDKFSQEEAEDHILKAISEFLEASNTFPGEIIVISNQVENGLISPNFLGRIFQELAGRSHQMIARESKEVIQMIAGLPQRIK